MWTIHMLLLFLLITILASLAQQVNYVRPFNSANCAGHEPCLTIQEYLSAESHLVSGAAFKFFPGNHSLQNYVSLKGVSHVKLEGLEANSAVNIILNHTSVEFYNVTNLTIEHLTFIISNWSINSTLIFKFSINVTLSATEFLKNAGNKCTGSIIFMQDSLVTISNSSFKKAGNFAWSVRVNGGAVNAQNSTVLLAGNNSFINNTAYNGGALLLNYSMLCIYDGNQFFVGNKAKYYGGGIYLRKSDAYLGETSILLRNNSARVGGAIYCSTSNLTATAGELHFISNYANRRGAGMRIIEIQGVNNVTIAAASFVNNTALRGGGAVYIENAKNIVFINLEAIGNSVTALSSSEGVVIFHQNTTFVNNSGTQGGAVRAVASNLSFYDYALFRGNSAKHGSAICSKINTVIFLDGITIFQNNNATKNGGAIFAVQETHITLHGTVNFTSNSATQGGAMYLKGATLTLDLANDDAHSNCRLSTDSNFASDYGGAIYFDDNITPSQCNLNTSDYIISHYDLIGLPYCFLRFKTGSEYTIPSLAPLLYFKNDSSGMIHDNFLYGGMIDRCRMRTTKTATTKTLLKTNFFTEKTTIHSDAVILKPFKLCLCNHNGKCNNRKSLNIFRGQKILLSLQAIDLVNRTTAARIRAKTRNTDVEDKQLQQNLIRESNCSTLTYNLHPNSSTDYEVIELYFDHCSDKEQIRATIEVNFRSCPNAFMPTSDGKCGCESRLQKLGAVCIINEDNRLNHHTICKDNSKFWMGIHNYDNETYHGLIISKSCPSDYCRTGTMNITLDNLDTQCVQNRGGVLCGACAVNYSLCLGSSACEECSNTSIAWILLPFVAWGIGLVFLLTVLRLTVVTGMINSLILYLNIAHINRKLFLPNEPGLVTIIAWLNFEFGHKACFYDGMDAYARTWLQFAFPLYVWILITLIIFASRCSIKISKWLGSNPVSVLATLLLMSYAKLISIFIEVYSFVKLDYPDKKTVARWLSDANVSYMESKHLVLAVVTTVVLLFLFLPYTFLLLLGYKLYSYTDRKYFRWLLKIKPLLDSYYAPYKSRTRYWTGFLLLVRCVLYIVFSFNLLGEEKHQSLQAIIITFAFIGIYFAFGRIYTNFYTNVIETSIYFNLIILSVTTLAEVNSPQLSYTLVGIFFLTMAGIIAYHFHLNYITSSRLWDKVTIKFNGLKKAVLKSESSCQDRTNEALSLATVTETIISLRESLLETSTDSI